MHKTGAFLPLVCGSLLEQSARITIGAIVLRSVAGTLVALARLLELRHMLFFNFGSFLFNIHSISSLRAHFACVARRFQSHHDRPSVVHVACVRRVLFKHSNSILSSQIPLMIQRLSSRKLLIYGLYVVQTDTVTQLCLLLATSTMAK